MKRLISQENGQFVIIAVLMISMMIISIAPLMHRTVTYYKHEPWEEYLALIGSIELNSERLVTLSLANYTQTLNQNILIKNLENWQIDVMKIYPGRGVSLLYETAYLNRSWEKQQSFSVANVTFTLDIESIGLRGYKFTIMKLINLTIIEVDNADIVVTVKDEDKEPVTDLGKENFEVVDPSNNATITIESVALHYDENEQLVYTLTCDSTVPIPVIVKVWSVENIYVVAKYDLP